MKKWEYKVLVQDKVTILEMLVEFQKLGEEGWELVTTNPGLDRVKNVTVAVFYFKRPIPPPYTAPGTPR